MTDSFQSQVQSAERDLAALEPVLALPTEQLWLSTKFGAQADEFGIRLDQAFARVVPVRLDRAEHPPGPPASQNANSALDDWAPSVEVVVDVEDWEYVPARRRRPTSGLALLRDLLLTLIGCEHPIADYVREVRQVRRPHRRRVLDRRVPGEGPQQVDLPFRLAKRLPPRQELPGLPGPDNSWWNVGQRWIQRVDQAWQRLGGAAIEDSEYEPQLAPETDDRLIPATLPAIPLEAASPVERIYWPWRRRLERDVKDLTDFVLDWDHRIGAQEQLTRQMIQRTDALADQVARLPDLSEAARNVEKLRETMRTSLEKMEKESQEIVALARQFAEVQDRIRRVRPESF